MPVACPGLVHLPKDRAIRPVNAIQFLVGFGSQIGIRPLLMPSRLNDPDQKIMWGDEHWGKLGGGGAIAQEIDGIVYMAMSLRNSGSGIAVSSSLRSASMWLTTTRSGATAVNFLPYWTR